MAQGWFASPVLWDQRNSQLDCSVWSSQPGPRRALCSNDDGHRSQARHGLCDATNHYHIQCEQPAWMAWTIWTLREPQCRIYHVWHYLRRQKSNTVFRLIDNKTEDTHGLLKYYEAYYKVITQHVTMERATDVVKNGKMQTLDNIINKTNCKNFGINYVPLFERSAERFTLDKGKMAVVGYDVAHPAPVTPQERRMMQAKGLTCDSLDPSVVGVCFIF